MTELSVPHSIPARQTPPSAYAHASAKTTTPQDAYYADCICLTSANSRTSRHSVVIVRVSDGARSPSVDHLLIKASGYSSAAGIGSWSNYREAVQALLDAGVQWFEGVRA